MPRGLGVNAQQQWNCGGVEALVLVGGVQGSSRAAQRTAAVSGPAGPHFRPMTAPPDFHRLDPPGPVPTSEREQTYADLKGRVVEFSKSQVRGCTMHAAQAPRNSRRRDALPEAGTCPAKLATGCQL